MSTANDNASDFLSALGSRGRKAVERECEVFAIPAGHVLFETGEEGDDLFVLRSGSLGVYMPGASGLNLLALIRPGETVGEMAVISGEPRSATVIAIRDSELLRLTKQRFDKLIKGKPSLLEGINKLLVHRLRRASMGDQPAFEQKIFAFLPVSPSLDSRAIAEQLAQHLKTQGYRIRLVGTEASGETSAWFNALETRFDLVFLCGDLANEGWNRLCARQSDRIFVLAPAHEQHSQLPPDLLHQRANHQLVDLIVLHASSGATSSAASDWLRSLPINRHYHLRREKRADWQRIARIMVNRGVGLVLSGGGARAFSQIGVLKALEEADISVDAVGGASMGGILAAGLAMEWRADELSERVHDAFVRTNPLTDITLPLIGLVKGRKVKRLLGENFGDTEIPDLWLPFFCVSSDLTSADIHVHMRGNLVRALRASISLPGILPPIVERNSVLVDGAVINNLPVDVMRTMHRGPVMAIDVALDRAMKPEMLMTEPGTTFLDQLRRPPIVSILMRSGTAMGVEQNVQQGRAANLLLAPPLGEIDIRDWTAFDQAVEIGYRYASEVLAQSRHLLEPAPQRKAKGEVSAAPAE